MSFGLLMKNRYYTYGKHIVEQPTTAPDTYKGVTIQAHFDTTVNLKLPPAIANLRPLWAEEERAGEFKTPILTCTSVFVRNWDASGGVLGPSVINRFAETHDGMNCIAITYAITAKVFLKEFEEEKKGLPRNLNSSISPLLRLRSWFAMTKIRLLSPEQAFGQALFRLLRNQISTQVAARVIFFYNRLANAELTIAQQ